MNRRQTARTQGIRDGLAEIGKANAAEACVVRKSPETDNTVEFSPTIARKGRSLLAKVIRWRDNFVDVAFSGTPSVRPVSDLDERVRQSEAKKRQLQRRINELLDKR